MSAAQEIREAALGPTPRYGAVELCRWIRTHAYWDALDFIYGSEHFWAADDATQRTFLLLVACALED